MLLLGFGLLWAFGKLSFFQAFLLWILTRICWGYTQNLIPPLRRRRQLRAKARGERIKAWVIERQAGK